MTVVLFRMVLPDHTCPFGLRAKALLEQTGFIVNDRLFQSREEVDASRRNWGSETTPKVYISDERIDGCEELEAWLSKRSASPS